METQRSRYTAEMECQRFVIAHMLFVTGAIRKFVCVTPPTDRTSEILCVKGSHRTHTPNTHITHTYIQHTHTTQTHTTPTHTTHTHTTRRHTQQTHTHTQRTHTQRTHNTHTTHTHTLIKYRRHMHYAFTRLRKFISGNSVSNSCVK